MRYLCLLSLVTLAWGRFVPNADTDYFHTDECEVNPEDGEEISLFNGILDLNKRWFSDGTYNAYLPYYFKDGDLVAAQDYIRFYIQYLMDAVNDYNGVSMDCLRIEEALVPTAHQSIVRVQHDTGGCSSSVGMMGGTQFIRYTNTCSFRNGTIMHEFIHALGFYHEQSRPDRDDWVTINWDNIQAGKEHNFNKYDTNTVTTYGLEYGYESVMHYSAYGFAIDPSVPTIIASEPEKAENMGQRVYLHPKDVEGIQIMYGCISAADSVYYKHLADVL